MIMLGLILRGFVIWLVPFVISFFFYTPEGLLSTSYALFKSVMVVTLTWTTLAVNLIAIRKSFSPVIASGTYLLVNLLLDFLIVVPFVGLSISEYIEQIGLIYLVIPSITLAVNFWSIRRINGETALSKI
jgi:hypothetical protein